MRKKVTVSITAEGRDKGKTFIVTEMSADAGERWATQGLYLLAQAGAEVPAGAADAGMAGLAATGVDFLSIAQARALQDKSLDSMWDCIEYQHAPGHPPQKILPGEASQIEEISTRTRLREEVLRLHLSFFTVASGQNSEQSPPQAA